MLGIVQKNWAPLITLRSPWCPRLVAGLLWREIE